ncbi:DUF3108 domain-containing protein [Hydrogenophaga sp.]|uniref:DUF3108 domain-containing protein n=1 Tax=Hydrogenophaga sp. TaxID=1904254 RepID=UPI00272FA40F|nr:DUF3108 domain-containing protein [Hydrogenophaga sp.]MDP2017810.1 DUF3108 domain-containing protein [Hydrogenophaga sp.]MDP3168266.1 DUF3108 domain-containing protein [Hydrogenophaga sp.]
MTPLRTPAPAPRWPTLVALIAAVLGVHMALLLGPLPWTSAGASTTTLSTAATTLPADRSDGASAAPPASNQPMARVSTVRWIVPMAAIEPAAAAVPRPVPRPAPLVRPAAPKQVVRAAPPAVVAQVAPMVEMVALDAAPADAVTPPAEPVELTESIAPEAAPAPALEEAALDEAAAVPDDELLAAAAGKKRAAPAAARALPPAQPPASTRLDYAVTGRIKGIAYNAEGKLDWTQADGRYSARMEMRVFLLGNRVQTSTGRVGPTGLSPERFADKSRSEKAAHFDAEQSRIRFSNNAPDAVLRPGAQDRLSLFLQIAGLLQARPQAYASGQTIEMQVAGTGDADIWRFEVGDETTLSLPAGEVRARLLKRLPRKEFDSTVEMWLAPALQHLPVRLRVTQSNGDVADQQLSRMP